MVTCFLKNSSNVSTLLSLDGSLDQSLSSLRKKIDKGETNAREREWESAREIGRAPM